MTPEELVAAACPLIGSLGGAFYFAPETLARGKELGLGGLRFYFLGRGGVLGDVEPEVVQSAFGYFPPALVTKLWNSSKAITPPRAAGRAYVEQSWVFGRAHFGGIEGLEAFCEAAQAVSDATDPAGLALYAGLAAEPLPDDAPARAMQLVTVLRELRGSVHLVAVVACGVEPKVAHFIRRPDDFVSTGWSEIDAPVVTDEDRSNLAKADGITDRLMARAFGVLDGAGGVALLDGARAMSKAVGLA